jgi:hypothetical protein
VLDTTNYFRKRQMLFFFFFFFFFLFSFHRLGPLACSISQLILKLLVFRYMAHLLGRGTDSSHDQLHRTTQHRKTRIHTHASTGIRARNPSVRKFHSPLGSGEEALFTIYGGCHYDFLNRHNYITSLEVS